jgi:hypothetical protein
MSDVPVKALDYWLVDTMFVQVQGDMYEVPIVFNSDIISSTSNNAMNDAIVYPNPSHGNLIFEFFIEKEESVSLSIFNLAGKELWKISSNFQPGKQQIIFNGKDTQGVQTPTGTYFYKLNIGKKQKSGKVILSR